MNKNTLWLSWIFFVAYFVLLVACGGLMWFWSFSYQWWVIALIALGAALLTALTLAAFGFGKKTPAT